jgi:beta-lactamase class A
MAKKRRSKDEIQGFAEDQRKQMIGKSRGISASPRRPLISRSVSVVIVGMLLLTPARTGQLLNPSVLRRRLESLVQLHHAEVGICVVNGDGSKISVNGDRRFPMQSVMKLLVGAATLEMVDRGQQRLNDQVVIQKKDLSLAIQPLASIVAKQGEFRTSVDDLIRRAIVDSDSAANDILIQRLGGPPSVQAFLRHHQIGGVRVDRDERHLQTEISGLSWRPEYVDAALLDKASDAIPEMRRQAAFQAYLKDERDTATPKGMGSFVYELATGKLLSSSSTRRLLEIMAETTTFPDRLKAGAPKDWTVRHKTGTGPENDGVRSAANDVGVLTAPDGQNLAVAVFVTRSHDRLKDDAAMMAEIARLVTADYR